jgi:hypothetical protein
MEHTIEELENRIKVLEERNNRVEKIKAWETSWQRKIVIFVLTYFIIATFLNLNKNNSPWLTALIPAIGFFLSTITLNSLKILFTKMRTES